MKKINLIKYVILGSCIGMLNFGCSEADFQKYPKDDITEGAFFTGAENVRQMLNDAYTNLRTFYGGNFIFVAELPSDNAYNSKFNNSAQHITMNEIDWQPDNGLLSGSWEYAYRVIARSHLAMAQAETVIENGTLQTRYINEAKYLRALMYFNLVRMFGDVPLVLKDVTNPDELFEYGREPKANIYTQIIADLKDASNLPMKYTDNGDIGYATGAAAKALLGEVYLTLGQYSDAKTVLGELITSGAGAGYGLMENYEDIFKAKYSNNKEVVFAVQYARGFDPSMGNGLLNATYPNEAVPDPQLHYMLTRGNGTLLATRDLWNAFESGDPRRSTLEVRVSETMQNQAVYVWTRKYFDEDMTDKLDSGCDIIVHRWADILLMYAEALNETGSTGEALTYLSQVRSRAGLSTDSALSGDKNAMFLALEDERQRELHLEGHRWFDLVRTGRAITVVNHHLSTPTDFELQPEGEGSGRHEAIEDTEKGANRSVKEHQLLFPIPQSQINIVPDKLTQNPGY